MRVEEMMRNAIEGVRMQVWKFSQPMSTLPFCDASMLGENITYLDDTVSTRPPRQLLIMGNRMTHEEIEASTHRLGAEVDKVLRSLGDTLERLRANYVCIGVSVCE